MSARVFSIALAATLTLGLSAPTVAVAQDSFENQLKARQGQFRLIALNLGVLAGMARGKVPYDAAAAQAAADNLVTVSSLNQTAMWPEGSDNGSIEGTRALPSIWQDSDDFMNKWGAVATGATAVAAVASNGQEALGPALGQIGGTCKACHEAHRAPAN